MPWIILFLNIFLWILNTAFLKEKTSHCKSLFHFLGVIAFWVTRIWFKRLEETYQLPSRLWKRWSSDSSTSLPEKAKHFQYDFFSALSLWCRLQTRQKIIWTHFSPVLRFLHKPVICFALQNKWLVSTWNVILGWNGLTHLFPILHFYLPWLWKLKTVKFFRGYRNKPRNKSPNVWFKVFNFNSFNWRVSLFHEGLQF